MIEPRNPLPIGIGAALLAFLPSCVAAPPAPSLRAPSAEVISPTVAGLIESKCGACPDGQECKQALGRAVIVRGVVSVRKVGEYCAKAFDEFSCDDRRIFSRYKFRNIYITDNNKSEDPEKTFIFTITPDLPASHLNDPPSGADASYLVWYTANDLVFPGRQNVSLYCRIPNN